ncbi:MULTISPECIES: YciI family protein [Luteimonas]|uniref:YciI family protein n=1 Tax=Luteimonas TaxID=83614 RepID=UPI000C7A7253|nr:MULTISPECIES: YciI family protein [Luteimonas]
MSVRYLVLAMRRPDFNPAVGPPHAAFLESLRAEGQLVMTGGFSDGSGGAYLLRNIESLEAAQAIVARDPLVLQGASELTVHEWNVRE